MEKRRTKVIYPLKQIYQEAVNLSLIEDVTSGLLQKKFAVSVFGASCILYMLDKKEYHPELEKVYTWKEAPLLKGKKENVHRIIQFLEDVPPYSRRVNYDSELLDADKETYVSLGFAKWMTFEDCRRENVAICIGLFQVVHQSELDMLAALSNGDFAYFKRFFRNDSKEKIVKYMKMKRFDAKHIEIVLKGLGVQ